MIHLQSNQRLYISEDLRGYVDKLSSEGVIQYNVDFLRLGFAYAVRKKLGPLDDFRRHEITDNTDILGESKVVLEAASHWHARQLDKERVRNSEDLLRFMCGTAVAGGKKLQNQWAKKAKSQIWSDIIDLSFSSD